MDQVNFVETPNEEIVCTDFFKVKNCSKIDSKFCAQQENTNSHVAYVLLPVPVSQVDAQN